MFTVERYEQGSHKPDRKVATIAEGMDRLREVYGCVKDATGNVVAANYPRPS